MQIAKGMRIAEAKAHVATRLGVTPLDLSDPLVMSDVRAELGLGRITTFEISYPTESSAMEAKFSISQRLGLAINSVERFKQRTMAPVV
jgi:dimethylamine--corrinoid protein Co-methyltransferase